MTATSHFGALSLAGDSRNKTHRTKIVLTCVQSPLLLQLDWACTLGIRIELEVGLIDFEPNSFLRQFLSSNLYQISIGYLLSYSLLSK